MITNIQVVSLYKFINSPPFKHFDMTLDTRIKLKKLSSKLKETFEILAETERDLKEDSPKMAEFRKVLKEKISEYLEKNEDGSVKTLPDGSVNVIEGTMPEVVRIQKELEASDEFSDEVINYNKKVKDWTEFLNKDSGVISDFIIEEFSIPTNIKMNSEQWELFEILTSGNS